MTEYKLIAIFYLLIRDHLPAGELIKLVNNARELNEEPQYTNPHILSLAEDLVERLYD